MTTIDTSIFTGNTGARSTATTPGGELGQEQYLTLMMAQFQNQDPFKPMESGDFLGEIAQFGTVSGISELQTSFSQFASSLTSDQTLQASGLIGRDVLVDTNSARLDNTGGQRGVVDLPFASPAVQVNVTDANGQLVRSMNLGSHTGGQFAFDWDGNNQRGERAPQGVYEFSAQAIGPSGAQAAGVLLGGDVRSVSLSAANGHLTLNFDSLAPQALAAVREIS